MDSHLVPQLPSLLSPIASSSQKKAFGTLEDNWHWTLHHDSSNTGYLSYQLSNFFVVPTPIPTKSITADYTNDLWLLSKDHRWQPGTSSAPQFSTQSTPTSWKGAFSMSCPKTCTVTQDWSQGSPPLTPDVGQVSQFGLVYYKYRARCN